MSSSLDTTAYLRALERFTPYPIKDDRDNERAIAMLEEIDRLVSPTPEEVSVGEILTALVTQFERRYDFCEAAEVSEDEEAVET